MQDPGAEPNTRSDNEISRTLAPPLVSVLIPAFNEEKLIVRVIESVRASFSALGLASYEIVVCNNNSTDRTEELAIASGVQVVSEPHNQISKARNKAAAHATAQWLIFLDGDTLLNPELLRLTLDCFQGGNTCGGGALVRFDRENLGAFASRLLRFWNSVSKFCNLAAGSYVFCLRDAWRDVGGFDETVYAGEELFFSRRIRRWGNERGMRFVVLTAAPVVTSARKFDWYGGWHLVGSLIPLMLPRALQSRDRCKLWYTRPNADPAPGAGDCN